MDCDFPLIKYDPSKTPSDWGLAHGEQWREAIGELVEIRTSLMREKNPSLTAQRIEELGQEQWAVSKTYNTALADELAGISKGSNRSIPDLIVLNNYTDFRDIQPVPDQGCSLVYTNYGEGANVGQTWDMHGSAKRYVCVLDVPLAGGHRAIVFSLVGCLGMMGFTTHKTMMGVNNINTDGARPGISWPTLVRDVLCQPNHAAMVERLCSAPKTSGHNYLIADPKQGEMWEVCPDLNECVGQKSPGESGFIFHTNHCLGKKMAERETPLSQNSTTFIREALLNKKLPDVKTLEDLYALLNDHEGYPKSICSNFQTDAQDPSITCGGAAGNLETGEISMWRGDQVYDDNFVKHEFNLAFESP